VNDHRNSLPRRAFLGGLLASSTRPLGDRLFFAGEALAAPYYQLCSGAYNSGVSAAAEVVTAIG
jgi:hypothetical protein